MGFRRAPANLHAGRAWPAGRRARRVEGPDCHQGRQASGTTQSSVNLFDIIDWRDARISTDCITGEMDQTSLHARFTEAQSVQEMPVPGCAEFRWSYKSPYHAEHMHVRFGYDMNYTFLGQTAIYTGTQRLWLDGAGPDTTPATFRQQDVSYDEHWGQADHGWVQDPGDNLPVHFKAGEEQEGDVVWYFDDIGERTTTLPIVPNPDGTGHMDVALRSTFLAPDAQFLDPGHETFTWLPSHVEYSYIASDYPNTRVEEREVVRDGRIHKRRISW